MFLSRPVFELSAPHFFPQFLFFNTMDEDKPASTGRKVKYAPKAPPSASRKSQRITPKTELKNEDADTKMQAEHQHLLRKFNEANALRGSKAENKSSVQVAFGPGAKPSTSVKTSGLCREGNSAKNADSKLKDSSIDDQQISFSPSAKQDGTAACSSYAPAVKIKKDYVEPWEYNHTYYPVTLPWRKPYSGDPELLDEEEFGEAARNAEYDETGVNAASDLGLLEESGEKRMLFFQLPTNLPLNKRQASGKGKEKAESSAPLGRLGASNKGCDLNELPEGLMGKMLVYKSGAVKLKMGDTLYDVSPGSDCSSPQHAVAINTEEKRFCVLGDVDKRAVVTPDIDSLLNSVMKLD